MADILKTFYILGRAYGFLHQLMPDKLGVGQKIDLACVSPTVSFATSTATAHKNRIMLEDISYIYSIILNDVNVELMEELPNNPNLEEQGQWMSGFYSGGRLHALRGGKLLAQERNRKNLTQEQLATRLGISALQLSIWENNFRSVPVNFYQKIYETLFI